jgi:hypothetical protein
VIKIEEKIPVRNVLMTSCGGKCCVLCHLAVHYDFGNINPTLIEDLTEMKCRLLLSCVLVISYGLEVCSDHEDINTLYRLNTQLCSAGVL